MCALKKIFIYIFYTIYISLFIAMWIFIIKGICIGALCSFLFLGILCVIDEKYKFVYKLTNDVKINSVKHIQYY